MIAVDVSHQLGDFALDAAFESSGRLTALFGPSGSGKTTLVNLIAGLIRPERARIAVDGRVLADTEARTLLPASRRRIGYIFQDARLFPHLTVKQNLSYGRFFAPRAERYAEMDAVVDLLGIGHVLGRRPALLSGGEKQRVAIGRALLASPRLILMDEPLASLDEARKAEILPYIERLRDEAGIPIVYVSHSVAEVSRLATDVVAMRDGRVTAYGPTAAILSRLDILPEEEMGEGGAVLEMRVGGHDQVFAMTTLRSPAGEIVVPRLPAQIGTIVRVRLRARDVMIATEKPNGLSAQNVLSGTLASMEQVSDNAVDVRIDCSGEVILARITKLSATRLRLAPGQHVFAVVKTVSVGPVGAAPAH
jgi:molybdate transport system ATP-binding protein